MNIFEVGKKENLGKEYNVYRQGICIGKWVMMRIETSNEFEFYNWKDVRMTDIYYISQILGMEFEEVIDWSKIPVDTKVLVSSDGKDWYRRHFAEYKDGKVYCFNNGATSFTAQGSEFLSGKVSWEYAKLYEE